MCGMVKDAHSTTLVSCSQIPVGWLNDRGVLKYSEIGRRTEIESKEN